MSIPLDHNFGKVQNSSGGEYLPPIDLSPTFITYHGRKIKQGPISHSSNTKHTRQHSLAHLSPTNYATQDLQNKEASQADHGECIKIHIQLNENRSYVGHSGGDPPLSNDLNLKITSHFHRSFIFASDEGSFIHCFSESGEYVIKVIKDKTKAKLEIRQNIPSGKVWHEYPLPDFSV